MLQEPIRYNQVLWSLVLLGLSIAFAYLTINIRYSDIKKVTYFNLVYGTRLSHMFELLFIFIEKASFQTNPKFRMEYLAYPARCLEDLGVLHLKFGKLGLLINSILVSNKIPFRIYNFLKSYEIS